MARLNKKTFKEALNNSGGNQSVIAKRVKRHRSTITNFLNKHPDLRKLLDVEAERIIDVAENVIDSAITNQKDIDAAKWKLTNSKRGKARGYGQKQEVVIEGNLSTTALTKEERQAEIKRLLGKK